MILESLYLKNIRSYKEVDIDLLNGISLFEGDVGSGKSTILMAIEFAFFGLGNQRGESLLRKDETIGEVVLNFEVEGESGIIKRTLKRSDLNGKVSQGKGTLYWDGNKLELAPAELKEMVLDIIDFKEDVNPRANSHIFRYAVYTPQEEMKEIINQRPDQRMQTLRKAFGIEEYKIAAENANVLIKELKEEGSYLSGKLERYEEIEKEIEELNITNQEKDGILEELYDKKIHLQSSYSEIKDQIKEFNDLNIERNKFEVDKKGKIDLKIINEEAQAKANKKLKSDKNYEKMVLEKRIRDLEKWDDVEETSGEELKKQVDYCNSILKDKKKLEINKEILERELHNKLSEMDKYANASTTSLGTEKKKAEKKIENIENEIIQKEEELTEINGYLNASTYEIEQLDEQMENIESLESQCPLCLSEITGEKKKEMIKGLKDSLKKQEKEQIKLSKNLDQVRHDIKVGKKELAEVRERYTDFKNLEEIGKERDGIENKIEEAVERLEGYKLPMVELGDKTNGFETLEDYIKHLNDQLMNLKNVEQNKKHLEDARADLKRIKKNVEKGEKEVKTLEKEGLKLEEEIEEIKELIMQVEEQMKEYKEIERNHEVVELELNNVNDEITKHSTIVKTNEERMTRLNKNLEELQQAKEQQRFMEEYKIWLKDYFIDAVKLIEKNILSEIYFEFNNTFREWFNVLVGDETKTAHLDIEFSPIVEQGGIEQDISYLSGGEKTSIALAYRLALNKIVKRVSVGMETNLLILDEPTDGLSKEQLMKLREILDNMDCSQIIMVSHERELEGFADNIIHVKKENGISRIEEMVEW